MIAGAYVPSALGVLLTTGAGLAVVVSLGHAVARHDHVARARALAWTLVLAGFAAAHFGLLAEPAGFRMLALVAATLYGMKAVVAVESRAGGMEPLGARAWLGFTLGWFGMRPRIFAERAGTPARGAADLARRGLARLAAGALGIALARWTWTATGSRFLATLLLLPGLSLVLHFGLFNLAAAYWRARGVDAHPLFRAPARARSLQEFWGRRWNLAFSEMTAIAVFRPLRQRFGPRPALATAFLFSGLLHELAISVPVRAGFGLPLAYFALHAAAQLTERPLLERGVLRGWRGRAWTLAWLALPAPILFHPPFLRGVAWPLIGMS